MKKNKGILMGAIFILVILGALAVAEWYQLRYIARIREGAYVIDSPEIAKNLTRGIEPEDPTFALLGVEKGDDVYRRGRTLYVGSERKKVEEAYPFFTNDGNAVMIVQDSAVLIDDSFEEATTYQGMYVSAGLSFNYDKIQADDANYLFLKLNNGLYMNALPIRFDYPGGDSSVRMNSVFYFGKDAVRYYAVRKGDSLEYGEVPTVNMLTVTIGGKTYSYEQFLDLLGIADDKPAWKKKAVKKEETAAAPLPRPLRETEESPAFLPEEFKQPEEMQEEKPAEILEEEKEDAGKEKQERELKEKKEKKKKEQGKKQNTNVSKNHGGQTPSKDTSSATTERPADPEGEIPSVSGNEVSGNDVSGNDVLYRPLAELGDFTEDIYSIFSTLKISDPSYTLKRVEVELFWRAEPTADNIGDKDAYQLMYRKSFQTAGEITIDNLPPDTRMYARGVVVYSINGETKRYEFYNGLNDHFDKPIQTKPLDEMDDIYVDFEDDYPTAQEGEEPVKVLSNQMQVFSFRISGPNPNVLQRVQSVRIEATPTDAAHAGSEPYLFEMIDSPGLFQRSYFYQEEGGTWVSDETKVLLPSSMEFDYTITLCDRFDNPFKRVVRGYYADPRQAQGDKPGEGETPEDPGTKDPAAAIDWNSDKSLSHAGETFKKYAYGAAEYDDDELTGHSRTARMAPSVTITQKRFADNEPNRDRAKFEIGIRDVDRAILPEYRGNYYLTVLRKNADDVFEPFVFTSYAADGTTPVTEIKQVEEGGETREYTIVKLADANFPSGDAGDIENSVAAGIYDILGLTAGCVYEIRIYGNYDLADGVCEETKTPQIWSQQFSTADLSSYGNVAYNITTSHIKTEIWPDGTTHPDKDYPSVNEISPYESATAQEISIALNDVQTSTVLRELMTDMRFQVTGKTESGSEGTPVLSAAFDVQKMKTTKAVNTPDRAWQPADASGSTGRFPLQWEEINADRLLENGPVFSGGAAGKKPALYVEAPMPSAGEAPTVWELIASGAKLVVRFEDGALSSNTDYQASLQTWAFQGDAYHDVSSRSPVYKSRDFRTLKKMPYVTLDYSNVLMVSDYIEIPEIRFHDDDKAIVGGVLSADRTVLQGAVQANLETIDGFGTVKDTSYLDVDYDYGEGDAKEYGGVCGKLEYHGLINGDTYRISLTPSAIIRDSKSGDYTIRREAVYTYEFVMGSGLDGDIIFDSITFPMKGGDNNGKALLRSDYSLYDAGDFTLGELGTDGTIADDSNKAMTNTDDVMAASPFIEVEPGGIYYIDDVCGSSTTGEVRLCFYANKDNGNATQSTLMNRKQWAIAADAPITNSNERATTYVLKASGDAGTSYGSVIRIPEGIRYIRFMMRGKTKTTDIPAYVTANCFKLKSGDETAEDVLGAVECVMKPGTEEPYHVNGSEFIPVKPGETYAVVQGYHWYRYYFYNTQKGQIGTTETYRGEMATLGRTVTVPANAAFMKISTVNRNGAVNPYLTQNDKTLAYKVDKSKLNRLESKDPEHFYNAFRVRVQDKQNNLIGSRGVYLKVYNETDGCYVNLADQSGLQANSCIKAYETIDGVSYNVMEMALNGEGNATEDFSEALDYLSGSHKEFTMGLYVRYNGKMIELDSETMQTDRELLTIDSRKSMSRVARYPKADFLVVDDIVMCANDRTFNEIGVSGNRTAPVPFEGTIDFQGHTLTTRYTVRDIVCFNGFSHDALLENMVLNTTFDYNVLNSEIDYIGGLVGTNYGTIRNVVVNLSLGRENYSRKNFTASVCRVNYGLIENFSLNYDSSSTNYVGRNFGGICRDNYGTIRNGYAYTEKPLALTRGKYGGDTSKSVGYSGLVCSLNQGTLENIYTVGDLAVELHSGSTNITTSALLTGRVDDTNMEGAVRNCFSVGNLRSMWWEASGDPAFPYTKKTYVYDAAIPLAVPRTNAMVKNNYFYSREAANYKDYPGQVNKITDPVVFRDLSFYGRTVNRDSAFYLEDVGNGYFPRVAMQTELMLQQPQVPLEKTEIDVSVKYLYAEDIQVHYTDDADYDRLEGGGYDYATATLVFQNEYQREIDTFEAQGLLFMNPGDDMNVCLNRGSLVKLKSEYQQGGETSYKIKVKMAVNLQNPRYEGVYPVSRFTYGSYTVPVANQDITVPFYKVVTQDNWLTVFTDKKSYYRLGTDIDFEQSPLKEQKEKASKVLAGGTFTGTLDGRGKTIRNFRFGALGSTKTPWMFETLHGTLKDIRFEHLKIDGSGYYDTNYGLGLVRVSNQGAKIQGLVLKDVELTNGYCFSAALVSRAYRTTIEDCVISNLTMHNWDPNISSYAGGMLGKGETNTRISNCLVKDIQMDLPYARSASGIGALAGIMGGGCQIENCYTQGYVRSRGQKIGGLVGENNNGARISSCWTKVDIFTERNPIGGIVGNGSCNISRVLSAGELYIANNTGTGGLDGISRIGGSGARSRCYAAREQAVNGVKSANTYGAAALLNVDALRQETTYWETINLGASFDCSVVKDGYLPLLKYKDGHGLLPEQGISDRTLQPTPWEPFSVEGLAEVQNADWKTDAEQSDTNKTADYDLTVRFTVTVEGLGASDFICNSDGSVSSFANGKPKSYFGNYFENFTIAGLRFAENDGHRTMPKAEFGDGGQITFTFEHLRAECYVDNYRAEWKTPANTQIGQLTFKERLEDGTEKNTNLYRYIYRAKQNESVAERFAETDAEHRRCDPNSWEGAMELAGENYENFMVMADLDFSFIDAEQKTLQRDLMINRLEGGRKDVDLSASSVKEYERKDFLMADDLTQQGDYYEIANLTYTTTGSGNDGSWIYMIRRGMSYLHFKNIRWTQACTTDFGTAALIRYQRGAISYIDISDFILSYGTAKSRATTHAGFIAASDSSLTYIRGRDIKIQTPNTAADRNTTYVGGVVAQHTAVGAAHVGIKGTRTTAADGSVTWGYEVVGSNTRKDNGKGGNTNNNAGTYTGGISGYGINSYCYADSIHVVGNSYTGGLCGSTAALNRFGATEAAVYAMQRTGITMQQSADEEDVDGKLYLAEVKNSRIDGGVRTGGLFGTIWGYSGAQWCRSKDNEITSYENAGGIAGSIGDSGAQYNMVSGCTVRAVTKYAGGIAGTDFNISSYRSIVRNCTISAGTTHAGGIAVWGAPQNTTRYTVGTVYNCAVYADKWVGGIYAFTGGTEVYGALVKDCYIGRQDHKHPEVVKKVTDDGTAVWEKKWIDDEGSGSVLVGGITGNSFGTRFTHCVVEEDVEVYGRKYVGGVIGAGGGGSGKNSDTTSRYIETGAKVHVTEKYGGGYAGLLTTYERYSYANSGEVPLPVTRIADVIVAGEVDGGANAKWVGGFVGAYTYKRSPKTAEDIRHPETGEIIQVVDKTTGYKAYISQNNFKRIVLAVKSVTGKAGCTGLLSGYGDGGAMSETDADPDYKDYSNNSDITDRRAFVQDKQSDATKIEIKNEDGVVTSVDYRGISGLRIFGGTTINGSVAADNRLIKICTAKSTTAGTTDTLADLQKSWHYTGTALADYVDAMYVTTDDLKSIDFYYAPEGNGGLNLRGLSGSPAYYNADGTPNQFHNIYYEEAKVNAATGAVFPRVPRINTNPPGWILGEWAMGDATVHDGILIPTQTFTSFAARDISEALDHVATYASGARSINLELPGILVAEENTQSGVMMLAAEDSAETAAEGSGRNDKMAPAAEDSGRNNKMAPAAEETIDADGLEAEAVMPAKTGAKKATKTKAAALPDKDGDGQEVAAAASGKEDVIEVAPESYFRIYDENGELIYEDIVGRRVYTLPYDYQSTLTVKVFAGDETRSYVVTGDSARHTVMTWKDHCYYLKADGVYRDKGVYLPDEDTADGEENYANTEKVLSGSFVNLYGGKALAEDGKVYDVISGEQVDTQEKAEPFAPAEEETPAYKTRYGEKDLLTYRMYTATAEETAVSDYRLFAHDGKLFGMDPGLDQPYGENFQDFVADYYATSQDSAEYLSALTENGTLTDYRTPLKWPTDEKQRKILYNYGIREVGDNLNSDRAYVVIRYENNVAAAFDYQTGSLLFVDDSEKETLDFATYVNIWVKGKKAAMHTANAYINAKGVLGELLENPVDDELLVGYVNGKNEVGADGNPEGYLADIATDGLNTASGENPTETGTNSTGSRTETDEAAAAGEGGASGEVPEEMSAGGMYGAGEAIGAGYSGDAAGNGSGTGRGSLVTDGSNAEDGSVAADGSDTEDESVATAGSTAADGSKKDGEGDAAAGSEKDDGKVNEEAGAEGLNGSDEDGEGKETAVGSTKELTGRECGSGSEGGVGKADREAGSGTGRETGTGRGEGMNGGKPDDVPESGTVTGSGTEDGTGKVDDAAGVGMEKYPPLTSDLAYVTMLTAEGGGYEIFRASELLNQSGKTLFSENQKLKLLEANGLRSNKIDLESMKLTEEENRTGILLVGVAAAAILLLLGLLYYKKRIMNRVM